jgi:hypothetical protein
MNTVSKLLQTSVFNKFITKHENVVRRYFAFIQELILRPLLLHTYNTGDVCSRYVCRVERFGK